MTSDQPSRLALPDRTPSRALPTVSNLTANHSACRIVAAFGNGPGCKEVVDVPAFVAPAAAAIGADVEAAPIVDSNHRGRRLVRTSGEISGGRRSGHAQCHQANRR